jgi:D-arabinono-1,4-lactone oxidase
MPTQLWMNASHSDGVDEWRDGALRIDPYWFAANPGDPAETYWPQFWELLRDNEIPFRLHWAKYQPASEPGSRGWVDYFKDRYPRWADFLRLREERDPNNIFLTDYWRDRFWLWDAPRPSRIAADGGA